jgi:hypothetical protein
MIGFFLESSSLKIFNDERILAENESLGYLLSYLVQMKSLLTLSMIKKIKSFMM